MLARLSEAPSNPPALGLGGRRGHTRRPRELAGAVGEVATPCTDGRPPENTPPWLGLHQSYDNNTQISLPNPRYPTRPKDIHLGITRTSRETKPAPPAGALTETLPEEIAGAFAMVASRLAPRPRDAARDESCPRAGPLASPHNHHCSEPVPGCTPCCDRRRASGSLRGSRRIWHNRIAGLSAAERAAAGRLHA